MEIGSAALNILVECWDGHLTPPEVASLADRASRARDPNMVRAAAELALSCLPHAHALNPNEIQRALVQCKEQVGLRLGSVCLSARPSVCQSHSYQPSVSWPLIHSTVCLSLSVCHPSVCLSLSVAQLPTICKLAFNTLVCLSVCLCPSVCHPSVSLSSIHVFNQSSISLFSSR